MTPEVPCNLEAEREVIGALILTGDRVPEISPKLPPGAFYDVRLRKAYEALLALSLRGEPITLVSLRGELGPAQEHVFEYAREAAEKVTSAAHLLHHAHLVAGAFKCRVLHAMALELVRDAREAHHDTQAVSELIEGAQRAVFDITLENAHDRIRGVSDLLDKSLAALRDPSSSGITTGYSAIDRHTNGCKRGDLIVVAARPSMGKTALAMCIAKNVALHRKSCVLVFSLEMDAESLVQRLIVAEAGIDGFLAPGGVRTPEENERLVRAAKRISTVKIFIDDQTTTTTGMRMNARRVKMQHGLDLIVVDYVQIISGPKSENRNAEVTKISSALKGIAREIGVPVIALSQLSRAVEKRDPPIPRLSDLRESGALEQDADQVLLLYRPAYYPSQVDGDNRFDAQVLVAKNRNGPTGSAVLFFDARSARFENNKPRDVDEA